MVDIKKHNSNCRWEKTTSEECEYRDTHYYCPHDGTHGNPDHSCDCVEETPKEPVSPEMPTLAGSAKPKTDPGAELEAKVASMPTLVMPEPEQVENKPGRPSKRDETTIQKLEQAFALDATVEEACFYAKIGKSTYYNWVEEDPALLERFEALRNTPVLAARQKVISAINTDPDIAFRYLERKRKGEFAARTEHTGAGGKDLVPLTEEQEQRLDRIAAGKVAVEVTAISPPHDHTGTSTGTEGGK